MYIHFTGRRLWGNGAACLLAALVFGCGGRAASSSESPASSDRATEAFADGPARVGDEPESICATHAPEPCEGTLRFSDPRLEAWVRNAAGKKAGEPLRYEDACALHQLRMTSDEFTIVSLSGIECLDHLRILTLDKIATPDLAPIAKLVELTELSLPNVVGTSELTALSSLTELRSLSLGSVSSDALGSLTTLPNLSQLTLQSSELSDVAGLASLRNIRSLRLENDTVSDLTPILDVFAPGGVLELEATPLDCSSQRRNLDALAARGVSVRPEGLCP